VTLSLTPSILEAAYTLLQSTPPFHRWKLPLGDDVEFHVTRSSAHRGDYVYSNDTHIIRVSNCLIGSLHELLTTMAHEMCHMRQTIEAPEDKAHHGWRFHRYATIVCRIHGFDRKAF
jgi:hypothetical protein